MKSGVSAPWHRHAIACAFFAVILPWSAASASEVVDLAWTDLIAVRRVIPEEERSRVVVGMALHGTVALAEGEGQTLATLVRIYDHRRVRISGYVVPLEFDGAKVVEFFLVPYYGACIHVPPPPPNQLIYVRAQIPFEMGELFDAMTVTGVLTSVADEETLSALQLGYEILADSIVDMEQ